MRHTPQHRHEVQPHASMREWLKAAILLGTGIYLIFLVRSGKIGYYINPSFAWLTFLAASLFLLLGAVAAYRLFTERQHDCGCKDDCHAPRLSALTLLIAFLPLGLGIALPPRPLGASSIEDGDIQKMLRENVDMSMMTTRENLQGSDTLYSYTNEFMPDKKSSCSGNTSALTMLDWLRCASEEGNFRMQGKEADVVGFVYHSDSLPEGHFFLSRFFMRHCMFDTLPIALTVTADNANGLKDDMWVRVRGEFRTTDTSAGKILVLDAERVQIVEQPEEPYLYP